MFELDGEIRFSLIGNSIDSINHAIDLLAYEKDVYEPSRYKRAILSISHSIELLFKERLRIIHPSLMWENVDTYPDIGSRTVSIERSFLRLQKIGGLFFGEKDEQLVKSLKRIRNTIEHYSWSIKKEEADYIVGESLSFAIFFAENHLEEEIFGYQEIRHGRLQDLMASNIHFSQAYEYRNSKEYKAKLEKATKCELCKSLLISIETQMCSKCGHYNHRSLERTANFDSFDDDIPF